MRQLSCFVIIPSNRNGAPIKLIHDERWGLVEIASGCEEAAAGNKDLELDFDDVYQIIQEAIAKVNDKYKKKDICINCERGQDLAQAGDILGQLLRKICTADITITDITTNNPNVFLEYGIRLAIKDKANIMICHKDSIPPFDVEKLRWIEYSTTEIKVYKQAITRITKFITTEIENFYLEYPRGEQKKGAIHDFASYSLFKQIVDVHTGRQHERKLVDVLMKTPKLLADFASFYYTNKKSPKLMFDLFKSFKSVADVLEEDPKGQLQAIEHLEIVSKIEGLSNEKLQETYYKLWELCDTDPNLKNKALYYLDELEKIEE